MENMTKYGIESGLILKNPLIVCLTLEPSEVENKSVTRCSQKTLARVQKS